MARNAFVITALFLFCGIAFLAPLPARAETITVRADAWPPFNGDPADAQPGYVIEVLKAVFEPQGITIDYQTMPWTRTLAEVRAGKFDGAIGASGEETQGMIVPGEPIGMIDNSLYVKKGSTWKYQGVDSLKSVKLGCIDEYDYTVPELNAYIKANKASGQVQAMTGDDALQKNIQKLLAGRVDVLVENRPVMAWTVKTMGVNADDIVDAGSLGNSTAAYLAFSGAKPTSKKYADMLDAGIAKLRASGDLKKILDKYGVKDWK